MNLRPKTKRRLMVLLVGAVLIGGGGWWVVSVRLRRFQARRMHYRDEAMQAYLQGDYAVAVREFGRYLGGSGNADAPALYAYGVSRAHVPGNDNGYLVAAKGIFARELELRPRDPPAEHQLLKVDQQLGYGAETLSLANTILQQSPQDPPALRAKVGVLMAQSQFGLALPVSQQLNAAAPLDVRAQMTTLQLMQAMHAPAREIVGRTDALMKAYPRNAGFALLRGIAADLVDGDASALSWFRTAAQQAASLDAPSTLLLSEMFDRMGLYGDAEALVRGAAKRDPACANLQAAWLQRQWENGKFTQVLNRLAAVGERDWAAEDSGPAHSREDARLLALKALSLYSRDDQGDRTRAAGIVKDLQRRQTDLLAMVWADLLRARFATPPLPAEKSIALCQLALARNRSNAIGCQFLGDCYDAVGETELALQAWRDAARLAPAWAEPHQRMGERLLERGQAADAQAEADAALQRDPRSVAAQSLDVQARYILLPRNAPIDQEESLLRQTAALQRQASNQGETLAIYVALLARTGQQAQASAAADAALAASPPVVGRPLVQLAAASMAWQIPIQKNIAVRAAHAPVDISAEDALQNATALAMLNQPAAGMKLLAGHTSSASDWQLARAEFIESNHDRLAAAWPDWALLADNYTDDAAIQRAVLASASAWHDRLLIRRAIDRLRAITGEEAVQWQIARARFQLSAPQGNARERGGAAAATLAEVIRIAPGSVQARVLWAAALEQMGEPAAAIDRLKSAARLAPDRAAVGLRLVQALEAHHRWAEARGYLDHLSQSVVLSPAQREVLSRLARQQPEGEAAVMPGM